MLNKSAFVFGCLSALLGAVTLIVTSILNQVMPKLGYVAFQAAAAGSYTESLYRMNFGFANFLGFVLIVAGSFVSIKMYLTSDKK